MGGKTKTKTLPEIGKERAKPVKPSLKSFDVRALQTMLLRPLDPDLPQNLGPRVRRRNLNTGTPHQVLKETPQQGLGVEAVVQTADSEEVVARPETAVNANSELIY